MILFFAKFLFLFMAVYGSSVNVVRFVRGQRIPGGNFFFFQSIGITGFIVLQWLI